MKKDSLDAIHGVPLRAKVIGMAAAFFSFEASPISHKKSDQLSSAGEIAPPVIYELHV